MILLLALACAPDDKPPSEDTDPARADTDTAAADTDTADPDTADPDTADAEDTDTADIPADVTIEVGGLGMSVRSLPDGDGDGRDELLVARLALRSYECAAAGEGLPPPSLCYECMDEDAVYRLRGRAGSSISLVDDADRVLAGDGCVGTDIVLADLDGDGVDEIVTGAPFVDFGDSSWVHHAGRIDVYPAATGAGAPAPEPALGGWIGNDTDIGIGSALVALPDLDGDGRAEIVTDLRSSYGHLLLPGDSWGASYPIEISHPIGMGDASALGAGDIDGDGLSDLVFVEVGSDLALDVWPAAAGSTAIDVADADVFVRAEGYFRGASQRHVTVADGDGDGYLDVWVSYAELDATKTTQLHGIVGAPGAAVGAGTVLDAAALLAISDGEASIRLEAPTALRPGEADGALVAPALRSDTDGVAAAWLFAFPAATVAAGGHLGPEDADVLWRSGTYYVYGPRDVTADGDWDGDGRPDLAFGVLGEGGNRSDSTDPAQAVFVLLDP